MNSRFRALPLPASLPLLAILSACSGSPAPAADEPPAATPAAALATPGAPAEGARPEACSLVTQPEMEAIVGTKVNVEGDESGGSTTCTYTPAQGISPYVELKIDWGSGEVAMGVGAAMNRVEPGLTNPLDGLGDQARQIGPALWVRVGEDLVMITMSGVEEPVETARRIVDTLQPRLPRQG